MKKPKRRKRLKRAGRLVVSKRWIYHYDGKNLVRDYAKTYGVDKICAMLELRMNGIEINEEYEKQVKANIASVQNAKRLKKEKKRRELNGGYTEEEIEIMNAYMPGEGTIGLTAREIAMFEGGIEGH